MSPLNRTGARRVLLIDAVNWASNYEVSDPLRNVHEWFNRWVKDIPNLKLEPVSVDDDIRSRLSGLEGIILSGSPRDAWNEDPINFKLMELVGTCRERSIPFLGVCYGHQLLARALGGHVARHPGGLELGNTPVKLTEAGRRCVLFREFPTEFDVLSSHSDAVLDMPPQAELTVQGSFTTNQGFQWGNHLFGVQFHPETDPNILRFVWQPRIEKWQPKVSFDLASRLSELRPTPLATKVLTNFVLHGIGKQE